VEDCLVENTVMPLILLVGMLVVFGTVLLLIVSLVMAASGVAPGFGDKRDPRECHVSLKKEQA
jgi:hypothetical protein